MNPRILLVEDDVTSAAFLTAAIESLPASCDQAASCTAAEVLALKSSHDAWLIDSNLPDGSGIGLLESLRSKGLTTPAIAHTADDSLVMRNALLAAGFIVVMLKPLSTADLHRILRSALENNAEPLGQQNSFRTDTQLPPIWDDSVALKALKGNSANLQSLRQLCKKDLSQAKTDIDHATEKADHVSLQAALHKLRASCGFVGAARLNVAVQYWQDNPDSTQAKESFHSAIDATLHER